MQMRRTRRTGAATAGCLVLAACSLDFDRYDADGGPGATLDGGRDASSDEGAAEVGPGDSSARDVAPESAPNACKPAAGVLIAPLAANPVTIDGDLSDWGSPAFTLLTASDAALIMGPTGTCTASDATSKCLVPDGESTEIALLHDATNLYVGVKVTVAGVGGGSATTPYTNDAVEIYLSADAVPTGDYTSADHQYIVDWQNHAFDYGASQNGTGQADPPGLTSAVQVASGSKSYVLEVKVALGALGLTALAPGQMLGFDLGVDHGQGTLATRSFLAWWMATHKAPPCTTAKCTGCNPDQPYCDTLAFGLVCAD